MSAGLPWRRTSREGWGQVAPPPGVARALNSWDVAVFRRIAGKGSPALDVILPAVTRAADYGLVWVAVSVALVASRRRSAQRAARRGLVSLSVASVLVNALGKRVLPRGRPPLDAVPVGRRAFRRPVSGSFPSGHAASAAAYATAAGHADPALRVPLSALAAAVGYSRVYTGVHHPSDVLVGAALGAAVGAVGNRLAPLRTRQPVRVVEPLSAPQPPRPDGEGVVVVLNPLSGGGKGAGLVDELREHLPAVQVVELPSGGDLVAVLREAAQEAQVLGIAGGDGSVSAAARVAVETELPLLVLPGGTMNHFAADLGVTQTGDAVQAVKEGTAIRIDVGTIRDVPPRTGVDPGDVSPAAGRGGALRRVFVNTASLGSYPSFVAARERLQPRLGKKVAAALAIGYVLRNEEPLRAVLNGREVSLAMMFIGNGRYQPHGFVPAWRPRLDDGILDVRLVELSRSFAVARLVASLASGRLGRSSLYTEVGSAGIDVHLPDGPSDLAWDGEIAPGPADLRFAVARLALTVYRPAVRSLL